MADKLLADFLAAQKQYAAPMAPPKKIMKANKALLTPGGDGAIIEDLDYIITKKPKAKKVIKYLQGMADEIMAEAD